MTLNTGIFFQDYVSPGDADIFITGIPFDGTVTGRPGTRFGPRAVRDATLNVEDYSPYLDRDISDINLYDSGDIELAFGDTDSAMKTVRDFITGLNPSDKRLISIGGEHLVSLPVVQSLSGSYNEDLFVVQFDAHADLRENYLGVRLSHASVMHHIGETIGHENTARIGIRSGTVEEWKRLRSDPNYFLGVSGKGMNELEIFIKNDLSARRIYLTIDLDFFDPGIMPGTGTPEPGGYDFTTFMSILKCFRGMNIAGADIVELSPGYDPSGISAALAATILREVILL